MSNCKFFVQRPLWRSSLGRVHWLAVLGFLAFLLRAPDVEAYRIVVRYDATDQPDTFTQLQAVRVIQSVMREYETLGAGKVVLEWGGVSTNRVLGTGNIAIFWDPNMPGCASMQGAWSLPFSNGALRLRKSRILTLNAPPIPNQTGCAGLRAAIVHELAHYFEQQGHPGADSVLAWGSFPTTGTQHDSWLHAEISGYRQIFHLWNYDFGSFPCGEPNALSFCPHPTSALVRDYNPTSTAVATMSQFPVPKPVTTTLATGGPGNSYTLAASNAYTIWVNQGNGSSWSLTSTINEGNFHRMCFATAVNSNEMLMAWPNRTEEAIPPWFYNFQVGADNIRAGQIGARSIRYTLSHDGGHTWDPVSNMSLPDVLTRTGVSCGWNPGRSAFVLAWQSATTDNVEFAESIPFGWRRVDFGLPAIPVGALRPSTHDSPQLYYDPFGDGVGVLVWQDKNDLTTRYAQVFFDPTTSWYRTGSATSLDACPPGDCSLNLHHRSLLTPAVIDGAFHETWSLASLSGTDGVQYLSRKRHSGFLPAVLAESSNYIVTPGALSPLPVYQQFAEDRLFVRRALLETQIGSVE